MSTSLANCLLFGALIGFAFQETIGAGIQYFTPDITQVVRSDAKFALVVLNVSSNATFEWTVATSQVSNLSIAEGGITENVTASGYALNGDVINSTLYIALTIQNLTSSLNNSVVMVTGDGLSANSTLTVVAGCGAPPTGIGCQAYKCSSNSTTYVGTKIGSVNTYNCYNTTTCGANGKWTTVTTCGSTAVGCPATNTWGANCNMTCGLGCPVAGKCHFTNGSCLDSAGAVTTACNPGYTGNLCSTSSVGCPATNTWGANCNMTCGLGCPVAGKCHFTNGSCLDSAGGVTTTCNPGYTGNLCSTSSANCTDNMWGTNCNITCGAGCRYSCDKTTGNCLNQMGTAASQYCLPGYKGPRCDQVGCEIPGVYGPKCDKICGQGCPFVSCDFNSGKCLGNGTTATTTTCLTGWSGSLCETPNCPGGCNGGTCFAPSYCGNCPSHFAQLGDSNTGVTCRNIRLDGFLKGSLPTFAVLTVIVILLTVSSKWYIRRKLKLT